MAKPVFFSFHYKRDVLRSNVVRNSWVTKYDGEAFEDGGLREAIKRNDEVAIKKAINRALRQTDVTIVLIGKETAGRPWIQYEIARSFERGNALLGIYIHKITDMKTGKTDRKGANPFRFIDVQEEEGFWLWKEQVNKNLWHDYQDSIPIYCWKDDDGYNNIEDWIEEARDVCDW